MLEKYFQILDKYRINTANEIDINYIKEKETELNIKFPQAMVEFYTHFGNDKEVLSSFYVFNKLEDIYIEYEAVIFGEKHEELGKLGILLDDLEDEEDVISWYSYDNKKWYVEDGVSDVFFFGVSVWQVLNTMPSIAKTKLKRKKFEELVGNGLEYLSDNELFMLGDVIPVMGEDILGCYLVESEELFLGAMTDGVIEKYGYSIEEKKILVN